MPVDENAPCVVLKGSPKNGFEVFGPFPDRATADTWAYATDDCAWILPINSDVVPNAKKPATVLTAEDRQRLKQTISTLESRMTAFVPSNSLLWDELQTIIRDLDALCCT